MAFRGRQSGTRLGRGPAPPALEAERQGGGAADRHRLLGPAGGPRALDARPTSWSRSPSMRAWERSRDRGRLLASNALKPWRRDMWCVPKVDAAYVAAMEPRPLWRAPRSHASGEADESPTQLIDADSGRARPAGALRLRASATGHASDQPLVRKVKVPSAMPTFPPRPSRKDPGRWTTSRPMPGDALPAPECQAHPPPPGVPLHPQAPALNMVEIEIGVLRGQCLDRRISSRAHLEAERRRERQRNDSAARIKWMFTTEKASTFAPIRSPIYRSKISPKMSN